MYVLVQFLRTTDNDFWEKKIFFKKQTVKFIDFTQTHKQIKRFHVNMLSLLAVFNKNIRNASGVRTLMDGKLRPKVEKLKEIKPKSKTNCSETKSNWK